MTRFLMWICPECGELAESKTPKDANLNEEIELECPNCGKKNEEVIDPRRTRVEA